VGVVFGTYSSVYVASALALDTQLYLEGEGLRRKQAPAPTKTAKTAKTRG
jgi:preprotein translocase subunit SecF